MNESIDDHTVALLASYVQGTRDGFKSGVLITGLVAVIVCKRGTIKRSYKKSLLMEEFRIWKANKK